MIIQTDENNELKNKLEIKDRKIQKLQIKLDSQDIIIKDYYFIKNKLTLSKNEILYLKKKI